MIKLVLSKWTADRVEQGIEPQDAVQRALYYMKKRLNGHGGMIVVDGKGRIGIAHNTPRMAWAVYVDGKPSSGIKFGNAE
jgi:beta-aspartyl-peptidase (threonine type)